MKKNLFFQWTNSKFFLYLSIIFTFSVISYYLVGKGPNVGSPDTNTFAGWADKLIKLKFNFIEFYAQNYFSGQIYFYTTNIVLISLSKVIFGSEWYYAIFGLNILLIFFSIVIFSKSLLIVGIRPFIISLSIPLLVISPDWMSFPRWILTDTVYSFFIIMITYVIINSVISNKLNYWVITFLMLLIILTRPAFPPVIFAVIIFVIIFNFNFYINPKLILPMLVLIFFITPFFFAIMHYYIEANFIDSERANKVFSWVDDGVILRKRYETYIEPPNNFVNHVYFYFIRLISFFKPYANTFSKFHIIANLFQFFYILISIIVWSYLSGKEKILDKVVIFILLLSFSIAAFHSFVLIDWDWRYRFPLILPLMMTLPITIELFLKKIKNS